MTVTTKPKTTQELAIEWFPQILIIITVILMFGSFFFSGGAVTPVVTQPAGYLRDLVVLGYPFGVIASAIMMCRTMGLRLMRKEDILLTTAFWISFAIMLTLNVALGTGSSPWKFLYDLTYTHGTLTMQGLCALGMTMMMVRDLRASSLAKGFLILMMIFGFMYVTPLGGLIHPVLNDIAMWLYLYPCGAGSAVITTTLYLGSLLLIIRIFLGKERLRV